MPYARQWEVMTKTTIIGATHNMASDFFSYWRFFMAEVPNQQEDLGHSWTGCTTRPSFVPNILSLVPCIYSICPYVVSVCHSSPHSFWPHCMYTCLPPAAKAADGRHVLRRPKCSGLV